MSPLRAFLPSLPPRTRFHLPGGQSCLFSLGVFKGSSVSVVPGGLLCGVPREKQFSQRALLGGPPSISAWLGDLEGWLAAWVRASPAWLGTIRHGTILGLWPRRVSLSPPDRQTRSLRCSELG